MDENSEEFNCFLNFDKRFEFSVNFRKNSKLFFSSDTCLETSDETTLSLPSISISKRETTEATPPTTGRRLLPPMKETERLVNQLKTENFNLKLRIYCLEKARGGPQGGLDGRSNAFDSPINLNNCLILFRNK